MRKLFPNRFLSHAEMISVFVVLAIVFGPPLLFGAVLGVQSLFRDGIFGLFSAVGSFFAGVAMALLPWWIFLAYLWGIFAIFILFPYLIFKKLTKNNK